MGKIWGPSYILGIRIFVGLRSMGMYMPMLNRTPYFGNPDYGKTAKVNLPLASMVS